MKKVLFLVLALVIAGGVYHEDVSRFFAKHMSASSSASSGPTVVDSFKRTGSSGKGLMDGIGNAVDR